MVREDNSPVISRDPSPLKISDLDDGLSYHDESEDDDGRRKNRCHTNIDDNVVSQRVRVKFICECANRINKIKSYFRLSVDQILSILLIQD